MKRKITVGQLITVILALILGALTVLIIQNHLGTEKIEFNTLSLLGFVLSILFGGASIVLAITAIYLGKSSEQMMVDQSQKSITLQNEVYIKTTEALKKIESSTGVTEKRIEDIIAGRVGDIASRLVDDKIVTEKDKEKLESELRRSLSKQETEEEKALREEKRKKQDIAAKEYDKFKDEVILNITNLDNSKTLKRSDCSLKKKGIELLDGLFSIENNKVGVCTFYSDPILSVIFMPGVDEFLNNVAEEILKKTVDKVLLVFNDTSEVTEKYKEEIEKIKKLFKDDIASNIIMLIGTPEEIAENLKKYVP